MRGRSHLFGGACARAACLVLLGLTTVSCASAPGPARQETINLLPARTGFDTGDFTNRPSSVRDTVLAEPRERVWGALPDVFRTLGVEATTLDPRSYVIGNAGWRASVLHGTRLSSFLQCGSGILGPNADSYDVTMQLLVQLEPGEASATLVRVVLDAHAQPRSASGAAIHCASQGTLEGRVVRLLEEAMAARAGGLPAGSAAAFGAPGVGRLPSAGERVRVGCAPSAGGEARLGVGSFVGLSSGELVLEIETPRRSVSVPTSRIGSLQIQERHSRTRVGAFAFGLLGGGAGAYVGRRSYDPDSRLHYGPGVFTTAGAVLGVVAGALFGAVTGSLLDYDTWVDVTPTWHARYGGVAALAASEADQDVCESLGPAR